jgi:hypothetical protein
MMLESTLESILMYGAGMEGSRKGRGSAREIFERGCRSGQRNAK